MNVLSLCESGRIPDSLIRLGVRHISRRRLKDEYRHDEAARAALRRQRIAEWRAGPIAVQTAAANDQHYEVPAGFFATVLGARLKYSCCWWDETTADLDAAERRMLTLTGERAGIADGQRILDLGCGWGSFCLWAAEHYPRATITAVSNSAGQREFIEARAAQRGLHNLTVITADINDFEPEPGFDRIVSVEMMEHARNHAELFRRIRSWLAPEGELFVHVFCHRELTYAYENEGGDDWMARHFFTGGMMPSFDLFTEYQDHLRLAQQWWLPGTHYEATSNAWLARLDQARDELQALFARDLGAKEAAIALQRWRMFFLAVAEFFGLDNGSQWGVGHYRFTAR